MVPFTNVVVPATTFPAEAASYQIILLPETKISETVGLLAVQNDCVAAPKGAGVSAFTDTVAVLLLFDAHPPLVTTAL